MNHEHERGDSQSAPCGNARSLVPSLGRINYLRMAGGQRASGNGQSSLYERLRGRARATRALRLSPVPAPQPGCFTPRTVGGASRGGRWQKMAENGRKLGQVLMLMGERGIGRLTGGASGGGVPEE